MSAAYALNDYTWKLLEHNLNWTKVTPPNMTASAVPIIPLSQQPEFMQTKKAFLIYSSSVQPSAYLYAHRVETIGYTVFASTVTEVNKTLDVLLGAFERQDEAARDVNEWLAVQRAGGGKNRTVMFTSIRNQFVQKATPAEQEGGYIGGTILLECKYIEKFEPVTTGFTY